MEKFIYLIIIIIFLIFLKYILISLKIEKKDANNKENVFYSKKLASPFIIVSVFLLFVILLLTFFWNTASIDKFLVLIAFLIIDISFIIVSCFVYTWKIEIKNDSFILHYFARKKVFYYKDVIIINKTENEILFVKNKRILKTNAFMINHHILIKKIIEYNKYENIIYWFKFIKYINILNIYEKIYRI